MNRGVAVEGQREVRLQLELAQQAASADAEELRQWVADEGSAFFSGGETPHGEGAQQEVESSTSATTAPLSEMAKVSGQQHTSRTQHGPPGGTRMLHVGTLEAVLLRNATGGEGDTAAARGEMSGHFQPGGAIVTVRTCSRSLQRAQTGLLHLQSPSRRRPLPLSPIPQEALWTLDRALGG